ncbi:hypothetical protein E1287_07095 [Actinomadura sp. KC06]|uniref:hypothetical protein n=1 Tax=Actinomadura sp. KC06 TaxID=2530369 RepID=UPI0010499382|nr:hypothetical protein [Actinomadura sp. KC06]TDD37819.1 hypothetical protein E1287_07095 [Actinomadura sp. KC06]
MAAGAVLALAIIVAAYLYVAALCWRLGHSGKHGKRVWSRPRPNRLRTHGSHAKARKPAPVPDLVCEPTEMAVAA